MDDVDVDEISKLAVPLLGVIAAIQASDPNIASTALFGASSALDMTGGLGHHGVTNVARHGRQSSWRLRRVLP